MTIKQRSFLIAFIYVLLGTLYFYNSFNSGNLLSSIKILDDILFIIFLPVNILPALLILTESQYNFLIFITQTISFCVLWASINAVGVAIRNRNLERNINKKMD